MHLEDRELYQERSNPNTDNRPLRTAHTFVHHYNSTQYCSTETVLLIFAFLQTNITSQLRPSGGAGNVTYKRNTYENLNNHRHVGHVHVGHVDRHAGHVDRHVGHVDGYVGHVDRQVSQENMD